LDEAMDLFEIIETSACTGIDYWTIHVYIVTEDINYL